MIRYLLFDLDNTLYSCRFALEEESQVRMKAFSGAFLGIDPEEAWRQRRAQVGKYGTNLEWLIKEKGFTDVEGYMAAVHPEGEADRLPPDPALRAFLENVPLPKAVLTNSPMEHARRVLDRLGFDGLFTHVFDIRHFAFKGKPHQSAYQKTLDTLGMAAAEVLFIDDNPSYTLGFIAMGGRALLLDEKNAHGDYPHPKIRELRDFTRFLSD